jgi:hypothetical protein
MQELNRSDVERADIPPRNAATKNRTAPRRRGEAVTFNGYTFDRRPATKEDRERLMKALTRAS